MTGADGTVVNGKLSSTAWRQLQDVVEQRRRATWEAITESPRCFAHTAMASLTRPRSAARAVFLVLCACATAAHFGKDHDHCSSLTVGTDGPDMEGVTCSAAADAKEAQLLLLPHAVLARAAARMHGELCAVADERVSVTTR